MFLNLIFEGKTMKNKRMNKFVIIVFSLLMIQCSLIDDILECDEYELGFTFVNNTSEEEVDIQISIVRIYSDSLEIIETESHTVFKSKNTKISSSARWSEKFNEYYRDINYYEGIHTSENTNYCLMIEEGTNRYFTYDAEYAGEYCDSCGRACIDVDEGYDSSIVYFSNENITSDVLKNIHKYHDYPSINDENIE